MNTIFQQIHSDALWYGQVQRTGLLLRPFLYFYSIVPINSLFSLTIHRFGFWVNHRFGATHKGIFFRAFLKSIYWLGKYLSVIFLKIEIDENAELGPAIWLSNKGNILLGLRVIGKQCIINQNVTIGYGIGTGQKMGRPQLGDRIWIGTNSVIHGGITIGSGVLIMPDSVVGKNIPPNCIVGGNPARIVARNVDITDRAIFAKYAGTKSKIFPIVKQGVLYKKH